MNVGVIAHYSLSVTYSFVNHVPGSIYGSFFTDVVQIILKIDYCRFHDLNLNAPRRFLPALKTEEAFAANVYDGSGLKS